MTLSAYYRKFWRGDSETKQEFVKVRTIEVENLEEGFYQMQGEIWSPNGEARPLIESLGLSHTSMSVGDVFEDESTGKLYLCEFYSFKEVDTFPTEV